MLCRGDTVKVIFYDLETTGFRPCGIMQICMIGINTETNEPLEFHTFVNPGTIPISRRVPHNLTLEDVREAPAFEAISDDLVQFIDQSILVGFNNRTFDDLVLQDAFGNEINDLIHSSHDILPLVGGISQNCALQARGLMNPNAHNAEFDVRSLIALVESHGEELDLPEQCKEAARLLVKTFDVDQFRIPTADDIPTYDDEFIKEDEMITVGIYAGRSLENVEAEDPWFVEFFRQRMA